MKRLLTTLFTLLFSSLALADASGSIPDAPVTDISIAYLGQIFGTVGNVLHGTSGDMLGQIFYKFNQGIFVVAGMFVAYTTTTMVLRSATEGSFMGPDKKSGWFTILRIPIGLALLIPVPSTGYETYQSVVMEAVVQGVNLADATWSWALDYLKAGGTIYMAPNVAAQGAGYNGGTSQNYTNELVMTQAVLANMTCMEMSNVSNSMSGTPANGQDPSAFQNYTYQVDTAGYNVFFPGIPSNTPGQPVTKSTAACGSISWDLPTAAAGSQAVCTSANASGSSNSNDDVLTMQCSLAQAAITQVVADLGEIAKQYACYSYYPASANSSYCQAEGGVISDAPTITSMAATAVLGAMVDYQNLLVPFANYSNANANTAYKNFIDQAKADGWIMAGRYFWDISLLNDQYNTAPGQLPQAPVVAPTTTDTAINAAIKNIEAKATNDPTNTTNLADVVQTDFNTFYGIQSQNSSNTNYSPNINGSGEAGAGEFMDMFLQFWVGPMQNIISLFQSSNLNPIIFIHQLGANLLAFAGGIWLSMVSVIFVSYVVAFICSSENPLGNAVAGVVDWLKPILLLVITAVFGIGLVLAYYVPLYPYIIFTFGTVGWFIAVIEAMVAAPLVCFGLTHPEGHDFLGRAEQALMLLLGVFLRPVLMVIGLISAMILSYVALLLLNTGYGAVISSLYGNPGSDQDMTSVMGAAGYVAGAQYSQINSAAGEVVLSIVVIPTLLAIFAMLVYTIIQQCYSLIFVLPDNILTWVGGPKTDSHAAQYAQQIESSVQGMGKAYGEGAGATYSMSRFGADQKNPQGSKSSKGDDTSNKPDSKTDTNAPNANNAANTSGVPPTVPPVA